jgi:DNA polymerase-3 subunit delta
MKRVKDAINAGRPMPMALRRRTVSGVKEKLFERALPNISDACRRQPPAAGQQHG